MGEKTLSIVKVGFDNKLSDEEAQVIESLLRTDVDVEALSFDCDVMTFHIWGKEKIDYGILDTIKDKLEKMGYSNFEINALEYKKMSVMYHYRSNPKGKK
ncbi:MAG: hypothetical protein WCI77_10490 [Candidatus Omnitrophota bacterium]